MDKIITEFFPCWPYAEALSWMRNSYKRVVADKNLIILGCGSHDRKIITLGRSSSSHEYDLYTKIPHVIIIKTDRGGGPTAHEPGQLVLYPVINLNNFKLSIRDLVSILEQTMLDFMASLGLMGNLSALSRGVFLENSKIGFIGMRIQNNISAHGLALNLLNDAALFKTFSPCNIANLSVSSLCYYCSLSNTLNFYGDKLCEYFIFNLSKYY